jgi:hypothetical protein
MPSEIRIDKIRDLIRKDESSQLSHERVIDPEDEIVPIFVIKALKVKGPPACRENTSLRCVPEL